MFLTPFGRLELENSGRYSLFGTVVVPGNGLLIQQLNFSAPPGIKLPKTIFPVQIILGPKDASSVEGALLVSMPLDFRATAAAALPVGGDTGFTHVALIVLLETAVVGTQIIRVPEPSGPIFPEIATPSPCEKWGWVAWRKTGSASPSPLHVQGYFQAESFGYVGQLTVAVPQGFDQDELVLRLTFDAAEGINARVNARIPVQYLDPTPPHKYLRILIVYPSEATCQIPVLNLS
jgi:hypothetical protein